MAHATSSLWANVLHTTEQALHCGALQPIATQTYTLSDQGIPFLVRILDTLKRKEAAQVSQERENGGKPFNPFLPYEEALFVTDVSASHVCLLNKFNVVDHHLLLITREYASQDTWLNEADFEALAYCLKQINGLGFYNGGATAGASQHHKHLQLVPFAAAESQADLPIALPIRRHVATIAAQRIVPTLPFWHSVYPLAIAASASAAEWTPQLMAGYRQIMTDLDLDLSAPAPASPYNVLITRDWMMGVRRSQPTYQGIAINSLGYAGWLLVKTPEDFVRLQQIGPMTVLKEVGCNPASR